jgi:FKBP-type peptidyl-prolyl cis-trans isomerase FkpA
MSKKMKIIMTGLAAACFAIIVPMVIVFAGDGFKTTPNGLQYRIIKDNKKSKAKVGDYIKMHMIYKTDKDSVLFSTREMNNGTPLEIPVAPPQFKGDAAEGFTMIGEGDSAEFRMSVDSVFKEQQHRPAFAKPGGYISMLVAVVSVQTAAEREAAMKAEAEKQIIADETKLKTYIKDNNLDAKKTASGLYYVIEKQGDGPKVEAGKNVTVNYTGKLLDGKAFDSNVDPQFNHVQPFEVQVGVGRVIKGWDEGLMLFNKGGKGKLIIPSSLGYGSRGAGANIPPNSILVFDVEIVDIKDVAPPAEVK